MPGRDGDPEGPPLFCPTVAVAGFARLRDELALAVALRAGGHVDHLAKHRPPRRPDLAAAAALVAGHRLGPRLGATPRARLAATEDGEFDLLLDPPNGFLERDPEVVPEVHPGRRVAPPGAALGAAEEGVEDVAEVAEPGAGPEPSLVAGTSGRAEHVVGLAALWVGQDLVRLVDLLEPKVGAGLRVDVRVGLLGEPAEGALDLGVRGIPRHAQDHIEISFRGHRARSLPGEFDGPKISPSEDGAE